MTVQPEETARLLRNDKRRVFWVRVGTFAAVCAAVALLWQSIEARLIAESARAEVAQSRIVDQHARHAIAKLNLVEAHLNSSIDALRDTVAQLGPGQHNIRSRLDTIIKYEITLCRLTPGCHQSGLH